MVDDQLPIPETVKMDPRAFELLRLWIANKGQTVSLRAGVWDDPSAWGMALADLARHIANSYHQDTGLDPLRTLQRIKAAFDGELTSPTDEPSGQIAR